MKNACFLCVTQEGKSLFQQQRYTQKKSEDCAWTPVVDEELLKFLESVEHKGRLDTISEWSCPSKL